MSAAVTVVAAMAAAVAMALAVRLSERRRARADDADDGTGEMEAWAPDWSLHAAWLTNWLGYSPEARDGRLTHWSGEAEQADAALRRSLALHDIDDLIAADENAAFVAFTVAEVFRVLALNAARRADALGKPATPLVGTAVVAATQRLAWHAAWHALPALFEAVDPPEPFGPETPVAEMPPEPHPQEETP